MTSEAKTINFDACPQCGARAAHTVEEHLRAVREAVAAADRDGIKISVRQTRKGVRYDYQARGVEIEEPLTAQAPE